MDINATILGQAIAFAIFVVFTMKFVWPVIRAAIDERELQIAQGLQNADQARNSLEKAQQDANELLKEAKAQAAELIEQANKRANSMIDQAKKDAQAAADREKERTKADIEQQVEQAKKGLRQDVAILAVAGAEKILQASVDQKAHAEMLDRLSAEL